MTNEFDLIRRYFHDVGVAADDVVIDVGDDAAVLATRNDHELVMSLDVLIEGVHFPTGTAADRVAAKAVAVNASDLAAMGATPSWFTLGLSLPQADEDWISAFAEALATAATDYGLRLVGGDLTRGPLSVAINICGQVPRGEAITRAGARVGDLLWLSGDIGGAALGLKSHNGDITLDTEEADQVRERLDKPVPRIALGQALRSLANAAIDVSDGLAQDLAHLLHASRVGARVRLEELPLHPVYQRRRADLGYALALGFGDDYELLFSAPPDASERILAAARATATDVRVIGEIESGRSAVFVDGNGREFDQAVPGHDHFRPRHGIDR